MWVISIAVTIIGFYIAFKLAGLGIAWLKYFFHQLKPGEKYKVD